MEKQYYDADELARIKKTTIPVKFAGVFMAQLQGKPEPEQIAVVQLDVSTRPDVAGLALAAKSQGVKQDRNLPFIYPNEPGYSGLLIRLSFIVPVACELAFFLPWPEHEPVFRTMINQGYLSLIMGEMADAGQHSLAVDVNPHDLSFALQMWRDTK